MSRVCFSPYEASLWEWDVSPQSDDEYLLSPRWASDTQPYVYTHKQLAKEMSSWSDLKDWMWNVVQYEASSYPNTSKDFWFVLYNYLPLVSVSCEEILWTLNYNIPKWMFFWITNVMWKLTNHSLNNALMYELWILNIVVCLWTSHLSWNKT